MKKVTLETLGEFFKQVDESEHKEWITNGDVMISFGNWLIKKSATAGKRQKTQLGERSESKETGTVSQQKSV